MKTYVKKMMGILSVTAIGSLALTGCKEDDVVIPPVVKNITETVIANPDFSLLKAAVVKAGLADALTGPNLTVFAPDNAAFIKAGFANEAAVTALSKGALDTILKYHVLTSVVRSGDVPAGPNASVATLLAATANIFATKNAAGVFINGNQVTQADITASNGVIHKINTVLIPPTQNIVQIVVASPSYSLLKEAVLKCGLDGALSGAGPLTVFAPNNAAFEAAGFNSAAIANATPATVATLTDVLKLHVFSGRAFSSDITNNGTIPTLLTNKVLTTNITGTSVIIKGAGNSAPATITGVNLVATNGVIHFVDKVLLP